MVIRCFCSMEPGSIMSPHPKPLAKLLSVQQPGSDVQTIFWSFIIYVQ